MSNVCIEIRTHSLSFFTCLLVIDDIRHFSLLLESLYFSYESTCICIYIENIDIFSDDCSMSLSIEIVTSIHRS